MKAPERITEWDRSRAPVPPGTTVNLHVARDPSTRQPYTLVARAGDISLDRWAWADWYSVPRWERDQGSAATTRWHSANCSKCGHDCAAKVADTETVCLQCVVMGDLAPSDGGKA